MLTFDTILFISTFFWGSLFLRLLKQLEAAVLFVLADRKCFLLLLRDIRHFYRRVKHRVGLQRLHFWKTVHVLCEPKEEKHVQPRGDQRAHPAG